MSEEILTAVRGTLIGLNHHCVVAALLHELHGPELGSMVATLYQVAGNWIEPADSRAGQFGLVGFSEESRSFPQTHHRQAVDAPRALLPEFTD